MKHRLISMILTICLVSVTIIGCVGDSAPDTSPEYKFETDCQYYHTSSMGNRYIAETETMFYSVSQEGYLYGIEKDTMQAIVLCDKPECLHDQQDATNMNERYECNAFVGSQGDGCIHYYDGFLYGIFRDFSRVQEASPSYALMRISLDGTSQKKIWTLDWEEEIKGLPIMSAMHRGKCYIMLQEYQANGGVKSSVLSYDLNTGKVEVIYHKEGYTSCLVLHGNHLFFREEDKDLLPDTVQYNLTTGKLTILEDCFSVQRFGENLLYYSLDTDGEMLFHRLTLRNFDDTEEQSYETVDLNDVPKSGKIMQLDEPHLFVMDGVSGMEIRVYDLVTGTKMATLSLPEECKTWILRNLSCSRDGKLILFDPAGFRLFYAYKSAIGTPDFQWHRVEKVN